MPAFRRVAGEEAGPSALGILVPPGLRTLVILRPRALDWDLVLEAPRGHAAGSRFWEVGRHQAAGLSMGIDRALEQWSAGGEGRVDVFPNPDGPGFLIQPVAGPFILIACRRVPGQPYRPAVFASEPEARREAERLSSVLCPTADANQEFYCNTQHFSGVRGQGPGAREGEA
jgi:hypothetical protein